MDELVQVVFVSDCSMVASSTSMIGMSSRTGYTRKHLPHLRAVSSFTSVTGVLQTGQARISSSSGWIAIAKNFIAGGSWGVNLTLETPLEPTDIHLPLTTFRGGPIMVLGIPCDCPKPMSLKSPAPLDLLPRARSSMLVVAIWVLGLPLAVPVEAQVDGTAEAYYLYCLGRMNEGQMNAGGATRYYTQAVELDPNAGYLHYALANVYFRANEPEKAISSATRAVQLDSDLAAAHRLLANVYFRQSRNQNQEGMTELAIDEFKETLRLEPRDGESRLALARLYLMRGQMEDASRELEQQIEHDPNSYYGLFLLAQVRREQGDVERAADLLRQSIEAEPRHKPSRLLLATLYEELGEFDHASAVYREALDMGPRDPNLLQQLATSLAQAGHMEEAAIEFERVLEMEPDRAEALFGLALVRRDLRQPDHAEALLQRLLHLNPQHISGRFALAGVYGDKREYRSAIEELKNLLSLPQGSYPVGRRAEFLAHLGFAHQNLSENRESLAAFEQARRLMPDDPRMEAYVVQAHLAADDPAAAAEANTQALARFPGDPRLQVLKAQVLHDEGHEEKGLTLLRNLSAESPHDAMLAGAVANYLQNANRFEEAEGFLHSAIDRMPEDERLLFQLGAVLERQSKVEAAETAFTKVLKLNPKSSGALNYLGYMLADRGDRLEESLGYIQRAVALDPYNGAYLDSLGWVYFRLGRLELAEENLLKAIERLRTTGVVYDHLGDLYYLKGDPDEAVRFWRKAMEQEDDELEKDQVVQKIEKADRP